MAATAPLRRVFALSGCRRYQQRLVTQSCAIMRGNELWCLLQLSNIMWCLAAQLGVSTITPVHALGARRGLRSLQRLCNEYSTYSLDSSTTSLPCYLISSSTFEHRFHCMNIHIWADWETIDMLSQLIFMRRLFPFHSQIFVNGKKRGRGNQILLYSTQIHTWKWPYRIPMYRFWVSLWD